MSDDTTALEPVEVDGLAREMARAYLGMAAYYHDKMKLTPEEAAEKAKGADLLDFERTHALTCDPDQLAWWTLSILADKSPDAVAEAWQRIKREAANDLASGFWAARELETGGSSTPWERAQYLALRSSFRAAWRPAGGIDDALIDTLAQCYSGYLHWLGVLTMRARCDAVRGKDDYQERGEWVPQRVREADAMEQAMQMVERFNRLFLRTLRALRDLRRYPLTIANAAQVNIGQQQVNVAGGGQG